MKKSIGTAIDLFIMVCTVAAKEKPADSANPKNYTDIVTAGRALSIEILLEGIIKLSRLRLLGAY